MSTIYNQNFNSGKTVATNIYLGVDSSGNFAPDTSNNSASLEAVSVKASSISANTIYATNLSFANLDLSGSQIIAANLTVNGVTTLNGPTTVNDNTNLVGNVDVSGVVVAKSVSALTLATPGGFSVDASGHVVSDSVTTESVVASSVTSTTLATNAGFSVDASGRMVVPGISQLNQITASGTAVFNQSVTMDQSLRVAGGAYINTEYTNVLTVGDSSNGNGVTMKSSGTTLNVTGITQDASATVFPVRVKVNGVVDSSSVVAGSVVASSVNSTTVAASSVNVSGAVAAGSVNSTGGVVAGSITSTGAASLLSTVSTGALTSSSVTTAGAVLAGSVTAGPIVSSSSVLSKSISTTAGFVVDDSANVMVPGQLMVNSTSLFNDNVNMAANAYIGSGLYVTRDITTPGGFSVDASGAVSATTVSAKSVSTAAGFVVDVSANVVVPGQLTVNNTSLFNDSVAINSSLYVGDGTYNANEYASRLTVGNALYENGVTMESSGTTLNVFGVTQDTSAILFPVNVNVNGGLGVQNSYKFNVFTDTSTNKYINIDSSNTTVPTLGTQVPDYSMPIYINGVAYLINLKKL